MENPIIELIHQHGSTRKYKQNSVPQAMIRTIIEAGQRASTSSNLQMYSVVVTCDISERTVLASLCGNQAHILEAPVFLTWCADLSRLDRICHDLGYSHEHEYLENFLLAVVDASIAAQNAALAAESLGLGFCYIGAIRNNPKEISQLLKLPHLVFPLVGMTVGWPQDPPKKRPRLPLDAVLHWGKYDPSCEESQLEKYDQSMIETMIYKGRKVGGGETVPEREYGWREHSARRVSQVQRPHLRSFLAEIGFLNK